MRLLLRTACVLLALLVPMNSFQNRRDVKSIPSATKCRENQRTNARSQSVADSSRIRPMNAFDRKSKDAATLLLSNNDSNAKNTNNYNDDAFGFVLLVGYVVTHDVIFAVTFVVLSALAAIATRNGKLPASNSVPAAVAGFTYIVNFVIPNEKVYELLPFIERPEASLPADLSLVELGICSVSILYGLFVSSSNQEGSPPP